MRLRLRGKLSAAARYARLSIFLGPERELPISKLLRGLKSLSTGRKPGLPHKFWITCCILEVLWAGCHSDTVLSTGACGNAKQADLLSNASELLGQSHATKFAHLAKASGEHSP